MLAPPSSSLFPYTTLFRSQAAFESRGVPQTGEEIAEEVRPHHLADAGVEFCHRLFALLGLALRDARRAETAARGVERLEQFHSVFNRALKERVAVHDQYRLRGSQQIAP